MHVLCLRLLTQVNEGSASASEILAGALHDNGRAILVCHRTFGKGKIQARLTSQNTYAILFCKTLYFGMLHNPVLLRRV